MVVEEVRLCSQAHEGMDPLSLVVLKIEWKRVLELLWHLPLTDSSLETQKIGLVCLG